MTEQAQNSTPPSVTTTLTESVRKQYLDAMGIQTWYDPSLPEQLQTEVEPVAEQQPEQQPEQPPEHLHVEQAQHQPVQAQQPVAETPVVAETVSTPSSTQDINESILACTACELHATRNRALPGEGSREAGLMLVVDAPVEESSQDVLLNQSSRKMLEAMLAAIGVQVSDVYITSLVKCRPPESRAAYTSEVICCDEHLTAQIKQVQPDAIMLLGEQASQQLLVSQKSLADLRLRHHQHQGVSVFASYHPSELINSIENKRKAWQDLLQIKKTLEAKD